MSLEDLRDAYKNSRQNQDFKLRMNGATYRKVDNNFKIMNMGNLISKNDQIRKTKDRTDGLKELDNKYELNQDGINFSLNKKKRWQLRDELVNKMDQFLDEDIDVRLYETNNRVWNSKNLTAIHRSKGEKITVKKTYANIDSIKKRFDIDELQKQNPNPEIQPVKNVRTKKCSKPKKLIPNTNQQETIVINLDEEDKDSFSFAQYQIEYMPKRDVLKYGAKKFERQNFALGRKKQFDQFLSFSDSENYRFTKIEDSELEEEEEDFTDMSNSSDEGLIQKNGISLEELINNFASKILAKREPKIENDNLDFGDPKNRKIYIDKNECNLKPKAKKSTLYTKVAKPVKIGLTLRDASLTKEFLIENYGNRYSEAFNCWPRNFNISLNKELEAILLKKHSLEHKKDLDIVVWLVFQEDTNVSDLTDENGQSVTKFNVSFCSNLICESIGLENINPCLVWNSNEIHDKAIHFLSNLPLEVFKLNEKNKTLIKPIEILNDIPNIGGKMLTHTIDDLKMKILQESIPKHSPKDFHSKTGSLDRTNSIQVEKTEEVFDLVIQNKIEQKLKKIFETKSFECNLCFDEIFHLNDCTLIKNCAHCICNSCMKDYIDSRMDNLISSAGKLQCPACDVDLELALMINFASNGSKMDNFFRVTVEKIYFVLSNYKWCPSPACSKILQIDMNSNPYGTVSCTCGFKMCLKCSNPPHFPARCNQISNYYKNLKKNNDFEDPEDRCYTSSGQKCPNCFTFMEKNGGCNHMVCSLCNTEFCWLCLSPWKEHVNNSNGTCAKPRVQVKVEFKKTRKSKNLTKNHSSKYDESLAHRQKRSTKYKKELISMTRDLIKSIKFDEGKEELNINNLGNMSKTEKLVEIANINAEKRKEVEKYLDEIISFIIELHFICEHSYVLLGDSSINKKARHTVSILTKTFEVLLWRIENNLKYGKTMETIENLKELYNKGLKYVKMLKTINIDEEDEE